MYQLNDVTKTYAHGAEEVRALGGIDLAIDDGEFLAVQGQTGSGKSTLLQLLGGLDRATAGAVHYDGADLGSMSERDLTRFRSHEVGFVFQTFNLIPTLSALENVETALVPLRVHGDERRERARRALEEVGLADRADHLPTQLSGGEQQRTAIARAVVKEPKVLLGDEPTGNLDEATRDEIVGLLERLWREHGMTLVVVTHDGWVAGRAPRVARLSAGQAA
jgi:putative ABC transport system ATP-binding protein